MTTDNGTAPQPAESQPTAHGTAVAKAKVAAIKAQCEALLDETDPFFQRLFAEAIVILGMEVQRLFEVKENE